MNSFDGNLDDKIEVNPWHTEELKKSLEEEPETFTAQVVQVESTESHVEPTLAKVPKETTQEEEVEFEEIHSEKIYSLDSTADEPELRQKLLLLQQKVKSKTISFNFR
jgi:hypothetical protein